MNKQEIFEEILLLWTVFINLLAVILTVIDKHRACRKSARRVSEKALFTAALLGGAAGMYAAMRLVRHKTLHKRFMIGLPVIIVLHMGAAAVFLYFRGHINLL